MRKRLFKTIFCTLLNLALTYIGPSLLSMSLQQLYTWIQAKQNTSNFNRPYQNSCQHRCKHLHVWLLIAEKMKLTTFVDSRVCIAYAGVRMHTDKVSGFQILLRELNLEYSVDILINRVLLFKIDCRHGNVERL